MSIFESDNNSTFDTFTMVNTSSKANGCGSFSGKLTLCCLMSLCGICKCKIVSHVRRRFSCIWAPNQKEFSLWFCVYNCHWNADEMGTTSFVINASMLLIIRKNGEAFSSFALLLLLLLWAEMEVKENKSHSVSEPKDKTKPNNYKWKWVHNKSTE